MRLLVFFDLPVETAQQRKAYRQFRKFLVKEGFLMQQYSVYSKMVLDGKTADAVVARIRKNKPPRGRVQVLRVTEKQYANIVQIVGDAPDSSVVDSSDCLVLL